MDWARHFLRQLFKSQMYSNTVPWPLFFSHSSAVLRMNSRYLAKITADKENCYHGVVPANRSNPARKITGAPKIRQEHLSVTRYNTRFTAAQGSCCQGLGGVLWIRRECQQLDDNPSTGVHNPPSQRPSPRWRHRRRNYAFRRNFYSHRYCHRSLIILFLERKLLFFNYSSPLFL